MSLIKEIFHDFGIPFVYRTESFLVIVLIMCDSGSRVNLTGLRVKIRAFGGA